MPKKQNIPLCNIEFLHHSKMIVNKLGWYANGAKIINIEFTNKLNSHVWDYTIIAEFQTPQIKRQLVHARILGNTICEMKIIS